MNEIHTKPEKMAGLFFTKTERSRRGLVRVQLRDKAGVIMVRKWDYTKKKWNKWANL